jgi:5-methylcytosine-specific restriction endonuclease McrA
LSRKDGVSPEVAERVLTRAHGACEHCYANGGQIHHKKYRSRGRGDPELHTEANLAVLCPECHKRTHDGDLRFKRFRTASWQKVGQSEADL